LTVGRADADRLLNKTTIDHILLQESISPHIGYPPLGGSPAPTKFGDTGHQVCGGSRALYTLSCNFSRTRTFSLSV